MQVPFRVKPLSNLSCPLAHFYSNWDKDNQNPRCHSRGWGGVGTLTSQSFHDVQGVLAEVESH